MSSTKESPRRESCLELIPVTPRLKISPPVSNAALNALFTQAWPARPPVNFPRLLKHALLYICAFHDRELIGFVKLISDGGVHGFILDPTVAPAWQRQGVGHALLDAVKHEAARRGLTWLHVDYEARLAPFYKACGFTSTKAGVLRLAAR